MFELSSEQLKSFQSDGYLHLKKVVSEDLRKSYLEGLKRLVHARARSRNVKIDPDLSLDDAFNTLCAADRKLGGDIYDHAKGLPEFACLMADKSILEAIKKLLQRQCIQIAQSQCVFRIDRPSEDKFGFGWHQDYWYNCLTPDAITCWLPLTDVSPTEGPLEILKGSQKKLIPVEVLDSNNSKGNMALIFRLPQSYKVDQDKILSIPMEAGDVLFFNSYLLHRSGQNKSNRSRWTVQFRYADFLNESYVARAWQHGTLRGQVTFCDLHPDMIVSG